MSESLLADRARVRTVDAHIVACAFGAGSGPVAFGTAEGGVHLLPRAGGTEWQDVVVHDGALLCLAPLGAGFVTGGDDGVLARVADGASRPFARFGGRWVGACAVFEDGRNAVVAAAAGRKVALLDGDGGTIKTIEHSSTVTGVAFDGRGKRVAAAHYNGASVSFVASRDASPRLLEWKGSHTGIAVHPAAEAVVTAMQENALHGWRLADGHNMRMSGYPSKIHALSFSRTGKWLASSGAEAVVLWPFFGGGPMGREPLELGGAPGGLCTRVGFNPRADNVAAGFADGSVLLADVATQRVLPLAGADGDAVTALAWSADGAALAWGTEAGRMTVLDLSARP